MRNGKEMGTGTIYFLEVCCGVRLIKPHGAETVRGTVSGGCRRFQNRNRHTT